MTVKIPQFCVSHTVRGTCTVGLNSTSDGAKTVTVPAGTYWIDPMMTVNFTNGDDRRLHMVLGALIDTALGAATTWSLAATTPAGFYNLKATFQSQPLDFRFTPSTCNDEGKRLLASLGVNPYADEPAANPASPASVTWGGYARTWCPTRGDAENVDETDHEGYGITVPLAGASGAAFSTGKPRRGRMCNFTVLPAYLVVPSSTYPGADFMGMVWTALSQGEAVRYYAANTCTVTRLDGTITATAGTFIPGSVSGLNTTGQVLWIEGEPMVVASESGGIITARRNPTLAITHASFIPVASDFVAEYVLNKSAMGGINPVRRSPKGSFWDLTFGLTRVR